VEGKRAAHGGKDFSAAVEDTSRAHFYTARGKKNSAHYFHVSVGAKVFCAGALNWRFLLRGRILARLLLCLYMMCIGFSIFRYKTIYYTMKFVPSTHQIHAARFDSRMS
jgi:hypothetical protein